jgi:hypothetical protein
MDRGHQLGRLRAWVAARHRELAELTHGGWAVYAEWLWLTHTVHYDALPDYLVVLDLSHPDTGFLPAADRDKRCREVAMTTPAGFFCGVLGSIENLYGLLGRSRFSSEAMEGAVLRAPEGARCKVLRPGFVRRDDDDWSASRRHNRLAFATGATPGADR